MSLGLAICSPEGIVLAAESRVTLSGPLGGAMISVHFDNATKLFGLEAPNNHVGIVTYGAGAIGQRTAHSFLPEFEAQLKAEGTTRLSVEMLARHLSEFYLTQWRSTYPPEYEGPGIAFLVAGHDENEPYGRVYELHVPHRPEAQTRHGGDRGFGITWGGQREIVDRLVQGYDARLLDILKRTADLTDEDTLELAQSFQDLALPMPLNAMALQDCVDLAIFIVRTTIQAQALTVGMRGCGGHIDVATITRRDGFAYVQRKRIQGEERRHTEERRP